MEEKLAKSIQIVFDLRPLQTGSAFRGVGVYTRCLLSALSAMDKTNTYHLLYYRHLPRPYLDVEEGFRIKELPVNGLKGAFVRINHIHDWLYLPGLFQKISPSVIHFTNPLEMNQYCHAGRFNRRTCGTFYDLTPGIFKKEIFKGRRALLWPFFRASMESYRKMGHVICISENSRKDLLNFFPSMDPKRTSAIPLAMPDEKADSDEGAGMLPPVAEDAVKGDFILYVGALSFNKNMNMMLPVLREVTKCMGRPVPLIIAGRVHRDEEARFRAKAEASGVENSVLFTGYLSRQKILELYRTCAVTVFPSLYEGFGLPALEAMSCGAPLLCSDSSSLPEVVGEGGILIDPRDTESWVRWICRALKDEDLRISLKRKGIERSRQFSWRKNAEATLLIYRRLAELPFGQ